MGSFKILLLKTKKSLAIFLCLFICVLIKVFYFPVYEAETVIMVDVKKSPTSIETEKVDLRENIGFIRIHMELLKSEPVLRSVAEDLKLYEDSPSWRNIQSKGTNVDPAVSREKATRQIVDSLRKKNISISSPLFTNLIEIKVKYKDRQKSALIANKLVTNYIKWNLDFLHQEVHNVITYVDKEVEIAKERLSKSEEALEKFKEENKIISLPEEIKARFQIVPEEIKNHFKITQEMEIKLLELEMELSRLRELYAEESPQVIYMKKRISQLKDEFDKEVLISREAEDFVAQLKDIPKKEVILERLTRDVKINETLYTFLVQEQEKARLLEVKETTENIKIVSAATIPLRAKGTLINLLVGGIISLIFAIGLPILFEYKKKP